MPGSLSRELEERAGSQDNLNVCQFFSVTHLLPSSGRMLMDSLLFNVSCSSDHSLKYCHLRNEDICLSPDDENLTICSIVNSIVCSTGIFHNPCPCYVVCILSPEFHSCGVEHLNNLGIYSYSCGTITPELS